MTEAILYTATATATGGREGRATSDDGRLDVVLSVPKSLGGNDGPGTNPEQLFGSGYAACFLGAVKLVARANKVKLSDDVSVTAKVGVGPDAIGYRLTVALRVSIPGVDRAVAEQLLAGAHERCPFSKATRGNIDVDVPSTVGRGRPYRRSADRCWTSTNAAIYSRPPRGPRYRPSCLPRAAPLYGSCHSPSAAFR